VGLIAQQIFRPAITNRTLPCRLINYVIASHRKKTATRFCLREQWGRIMKCLTFTLSCVIAFSAAPTFADISCTPGTPLPSQNRTLMKHRKPPTAKPNIILTTVAEMATAHPAAGVAVAGFKMANRPIDPHENGVITLKGDLWAINIEANDCDFHLEISDVGNSSADDRIIAEIPQGPFFLAARNALIRQLSTAGIRPSRRIRFTQPIRVQVLGYAFFDAWHYSAANPQRGNNHGSPQVASIWEIHPVWAIIFPAN
jgi:hypothetical protein